MPPNTSDPNASPSPAPDYSFIMSPSAPQASSGGLPGGNSKVLRIAFISGGIMVLLVIFLIIKSVLGGNNANLPLTSVVQDQQAILHIISSTKDNSSDKSLAGDTQNFADTAQLALTTSQSDLLAYMNSNKIKVKPAVLSQKISSANDNQLSAASQAGTYDQAFRQIMNQLLLSYQKDLQSAYPAAPGPKGRALIKSDFDQSKLLIQALQHPQS
jgi:hypothetical protein